MQQRGRVQHRSGCTRPRQAAAVQRTVSLYGDATDRPGALPSEEQQQQHSLPVSRVVGGGYRRTQSTQFSAVPQQDEGRQRDPASQEDKEQGEVVLPCFTAPDRVPPSWSETDEEDAPSSTEWEDADGDVVQDSNAQKEAQKPASRTLGCTTEAAVQIVHDPESVRCTKPTLSQSASATSSVDVLSFHRRQTTAVIELEDLSVVLPLPRSRDEEAPASPSLLPSTPTGKIRNRLALFFKNDIVRTFCTVLGLPEASLKPKESRVILNRVSGMFTPGKMTAVIGPSGSGKSTLLNVLGGRLSHSSGTLKLGGIATRNPQDLKKHSAFVQQLDLFLQHLTVREHLETQICLRLGSGCPSAIRTAFADALITRFGLLKCQHVPIGTAGMKRAISGGERKRLSVATELITNPDVLLADEPTTGLDSTMAASVVSTLRGLAQSGRTVVASLHQPSSSLFAMFDEVVLLSEGHVIYFGDRLGSIEWFRRLGHECPKFANPCDFLIRTVSLPEAFKLRHAKVLELQKWAARWHQEGEQFLCEWASGGHAAFLELSRTFAEKSMKLALGRSQAAFGTTDGTAYDARSYTAPLHLFDRDAADARPRTYVGPASRRHHQISGGASQFDAIGSRCLSHTGRCYDQSLASQSDTTIGRRSHRGVDESKVMMPRRAVGVDTDELHAMLAMQADDTRTGCARWWHQLGVLTWRAVASNKRDPILLYARALQTAAVALVYGSLFFQLGPSLADVKSKASAIFLVLTNQGMIGAVGVCATFPSEKPVIYREAEGGIISMSPYIIAKMLADTPIQIVFPILFNAVTFSMMNLVPNLPKFALGCLITLLVANAAISVGYLGSATAPNSDMALITAQFWVMPGLLFGGFAIKLDDIPKYLSWLQYASYFRYGFIAYLQIIFDGMDIKIPTPFGELSYSGRAFVADYFGIQIGGARRLWTLIGCLFLMTFLFRCLTVAVVVPASKRWRENAA